MKMRAFANVLVLFLLVVLFFGLVLAVPMPPHQLFGVVTLNGSPAPGNVTITAKVEGIEVSITSTVNGVYGKDSAELFFVPDPNGNNRGKTIELFVSGTKKAEIIFENAGLTE
jgi:hypothetical protein